MDSCDSYGRISKCDGKADSERKTRRFRSVCMPDFI